MPSSIDQNTSGLNPAHDPRPIDQAFLKKLHDIVNDNIAADNLGVDFIADRMCMSPSTLYRKIMANTGVSTNEFVRRARLERSLRLLVQGSMSITDIAFACGFSSHSTFAKAFKKEYGTTATEYASRHNESADAS